jgi:rSAM/selenodomain-associated transferase 1
MARFPVLGTVKTRLAADIGQIDALSVYRKLLSHAVGEVLTLKSDQFFRAVFVAESDHLFKFTAEFPGFDAVHEQNGKDLGERMFSAVRILQQSDDISGALIVGPDIPRLTASTIESAGRLLSNHDLVLGPTEDGGYYLIGMSRPVKELFLDIAWSTSTVLRQSLAIAGQKGLCVKTLPVLRDLDTAEDLSFFADFAPGTKESA